MRVVAWPLTLGSTGNPYPERLSSSLRARGVEVEPFTRAGVVRRPPDVLHIHWPDGPVQATSRLRAAALGMSLVLVLAYLRLRGTALVWTAHNLRPHEVQHPRLLALYWWCLSRLLTGWIALSHSALEPVRQVHPALRRRRAFVVRHGNYRGVYPAQSRAMARGEAGIEDGASVVLFFGQVRPYKGVPELVAAFRALPEAHRRLVIAGRPADDGVVAEVRDAVGDDTRVDLRLRFIADDELSACFALADLVVLPFREVLNSGSALLALSLDRPVLLPSGPSFEELKELVGPQWVLTYDGGLDAHQLDAATQEAEHRRGEVPDLAVFEWGKIAQGTEAAYRALIRRK